jgi:hypothetical protein
LAWSVVARPDFAISINSTKLQIRAPAMRRGIADAFACAPHEAGPAMPQRGAAYAPEPLSLQGLIAYVHAADDTEDAGRCMSLFLGTRTWSDDGIRINFATEARNAIHALSDGSRGFHVGIAARSAQFGAIPPDLPPAVH